MTLILYWLSFLISADAVRVSGAPTVAFLTTRRATGLSMMKLNGEFTMTIEAVAVCAPMLRPAASNCCLILVMAPLTTPERR
jgi:hypothetical protein